MDFLLSFTVPDQNTGACATSDYYDYGRDYGVDDNQGSARHCHGRRCFGQTTEVEDDYEFAGGVLAFAGYAPTTLPCITCHPEFLSTS